MVGVGGGILVTKFYMNYVGCKVGMRTENRPVMLKFYMNYVGCKGFL